VWILVIMVGLLGAIAAGSIYNVQFDKPFIEITSPKNNDSIKIAAVDSNMISGTYVVEGSSKNIVAREDLRICTLIHSANPIGTGWWMWPLPTVYDDGTWQGQAGAGGKDFPVAIGQEYDIVAVAASKEKIYAINHGVATLDIKDLDPKAISNRVHVSIGSIIYDKTAK
jgi:hypothetical protein